jgi:MAF protein
VDESRTFELILASGSSTRRKLLEAAGLEFTVVRPTVDEDVVRETMMANNEFIDPADVAEVLARAKAEDVSGLYPDAIVIGADQVLACQGQIFTKPDSVDAARETLMALRGRTHQLHTAVTIAEGGEARWAFVDTANLTMRDFSLAFLGLYLATAGERVTDSVGAYQLEGLGIQLFERIEGDYFTILGLPLLPLLEELRKRKVIQE